ncbi:MULTISPECIES: branched-chain amino acid ABC transporter permease [Caldilinea]|jgi:branched-chain amino acid transport system permease protein|uniref:Putative branched-chain amino acid ABC transporter permease protein n=1 Tax=Caldilinea aerophila (strain DSM 14535 / JCM 11387 / NBRC 104270 / STL-6-O1) TaxID=926550 RepID=I0I1N3_CALAS|nr:MULTISPECIES: branched-chain amino acid ABC transporter permease [Caldilinea]MBO9394337.1 branched-chain amino acid ABC transporter permease [Caldilinea sp.]BAL99170.1 putative branched-chain amino acid ABC transporter permease protein [Caldilinea aerophila DSM 14535 = NBRC 104270]GIV74238.1 MAG: branched-chain amino acid ABC transporter permease [Caldilinea sp.]
MRLRRVNPIKEILRPLGQLLIFVLGSAVIVSAFVLLLALLLRPTRTDIDIFQVTLILLPQVLIDGITLGFMYAIIAMGYTMVYGVLEFINFAHGEFVMFGAFAGVELLIWLNAQGILRTSELWLAMVWLILAVLLGMGVGGTLAVSAERFAYRPLRGTPRLVPLIAAIGVSFLLQDTMRFLQSAIHGDFYRTFPEFGPFAQRLTLFSLSIDGRSIDIAIQYKALLLITFAIIMLVALNYLVNATRLGKAIRSVAQDQRTASLMGIDVNRIIALTFLIGGAMGGAAGVLWTFRFTRADPYMGFIPGLKAFTAAVLGGIGSIVGAMLGGMVLGLLESFAASYFSIFSRGAFGAEYKDIFAFGILILVLIFRPQGLLGGKTTQKA